MEFSRTNRGFGLIEFEDLYGSKCSVQDSSLADKDAIWLGVDDADPKIMASHAPSFGVATTETCGWVPFPIPDQVLLSTRMHLDRKQAKELIKVLRSFVKTGRLPELPATPQSLDGGEQP